MASLLEELQLLGAASLEDRIERPVVAIYRADESNAIFFRVCVSDVGFLHMLRDNLLQG